MGDSSPQDLQDFVNDILSGRDTGPSSSALDLVDEILSGRPGKHKDKVDELLRSQPAVSDRDLVDEVLRGPPLYDKSKEVESDDFLDVGYPSAETKDIAPLPSYPPPPAPPAISTSAAPPSQSPRSSRRVSLSHQPVPGRSSGGPRMVLLCSENRKSQKAFTLQGTVSYERLKDKVTAKMGESWRVLYFEDRDGDKILVDDDESVSVFLHQRGKLRLHCCAALPLSAARTQEEPMYYAGVSSPHPPSARKCHHGPTCNERAPPHTARTPAYAFDYGEPEVVEPPMNFYPPMSARSYAGGQDAASLMRRVYHDSARGLPSARSYVSSRHSVGRTTPRPA
eukprot:Sspe_Gene.61856::Locus_34449_Transcript_1_1_Confidence_1.000_Length_1626::g.61856::m.61856